MKKSLLLLGIPLLLACGPFFYQAPPPIATYPERTPGKSWQQLLDTSYSPSGEKKSALIEECHTLVKSIDSSDKAKTLTTITALQQRNRDGEFSIKIANFLIEFRELIATDTDHTVIQPYLADQAEELPGGFYVIQEPVKTWRQTDTEYAMLLEEVRARLEIKTSKLDQNINEGPEALRPNFLVQRGAFLFRCGKVDLAASDFRTVVSAFPEHPRAEVAAFMFGRCALHHARALKPKATNPSREEIDLWRDALTTAKKSFNAYIKKYPEGRFADDAHGWTGAVARDRGDLAMAFNQQLTRLDLQPTREVAYSVMREVDSLLDQMLEENPGTLRGDYDYGMGNSLDFDRMVKYPAVTRQFIYHSLDPAARMGLPYYFEDYRGGRKTIDFLNNKVVRNDEFTTAGLAQLARAIAKSNAPTDELSALILSWSLIRANDSSQALAIADRALAAVSTDDLIQVRAVALSHLGRHAESAQAYQLLIKEFSGSPLAEPSQFDYAMELRHAGQAGKALVTLLDLHEPVYLDNEDRPSAPRLHSADEVIQWIDTIAQFSPVDELRAALENLPADSQHVATLRSIVRTRLLCHGEFDAAKIYLDAPLQPDQINEPYNPAQWNPKRWAHLDQERWDSDVAPLAKIASELKSASGDQLQTLHLNAAQHWQKLRGKLTLPRLAKFDYSNSETEKIDQLRRTNARLMGIDEKTITAELDSSDELHHALNHFLKAASGGDPTKKLTALFNANEALFRLAEFSPYRLSRAVEENHSALSLKLVEQMTSQFPEKDLTKSAIDFTFSPPATLREWMPGDYNSNNSDDYIDEAISGQDSFAGWRYHYDESEKKVAARNQLKELHAKIKKLGDSPVKDPKAVTESLRMKFTALRPNLDREEILSIVDTIDDLHTAAHTNGVSPELFSAYVSKRQTMNPKPTTGLDWQPLMPFLVFIDKLRMEDGYKSKLQEPKSDSTSRWQNYLERYPDGPKSEAVEFRLLRDEVRAIVPIPHVEAFHFPEAPIANGYKNIEFHVNLSTHGEMLGALIQAYREKYPNGRYSMDVNLLEAAVLAVSGKYAEALPLVTKVLDDPIHNEIRQDAALHFAAIALQLLDPEARGELIPAFRTTPNAMMYLERLVNGNTCVSRVRPLMAALKAEK